MAEMLKYNPIARIKDWGFADMGFGKNQRQLYDKSAMTLSDKISEASGFLPSQADKVTWARIWAAVKLEQQAKGVMDVARWAERFREVISSTQVVNTIFTTPPILNEGSTLTSMATAFMAEPLKSFNMLHDAVSSQKRRADQANGGDAYHEYVCYCDNRYSVQTSEAERRRRGYHVIVAVRRSASQYGKRTLDVAVRGT